MVGMWVTDMYLVKSKRSQMGGWSIEEESGKVVADKWLHHLRFTLTEALAATSWSDKQSQPNAPSISQVIVIHRPITIIPISYSSPTLSLSQASTCHCRREQRAGVSGNKITTEASPPVKHSVIVTVQTPGCSTWSHNQKVPRTGYKRLAIRPRLELLSDHPHHATQAQGRRRLGVPPVQARGVRCEYSRQHGQ